MHPCACPHIPALPLLTLPPYQNKANLIIDILNFSVALCLEHLPQILRSVALQELLQGRDVFWDRH